MTVEVNWIKGSINPPQDGTYYTIIRATKDIKDLIPNVEYCFCKQGDYMVDNDFWDNETKQWSTLGKDNPYWNVEAWAYIEKPPIPKEIMPRVKWYFGKEINTDEQS